ncbi:MAG: helix-turn-helix transcriptional regulator [Verrucomicrobiae bacterium]|nr:helix-turn-helix transcriptional regulator [Verrucomicrobiae bacterium]
MKTMRQLKARDYMSPLRPAHFGQIRLETDRGITLHTHNYHELFWITEGRGLHLINGARRPLREKCLVLIRSADVHDFVPDPGRFLGIANVAFSTGTWRRLFERCFPGITDPMSLPHVRDREFLLDDSQWADLQLASVDLAAGRRGIFETELFLLNLFKILGLGKPLAAEAPPLPEWLERAVREIRQPAHFIGGTPAFARLAGRSGEHVARVLKRLRGLTPTDLVNEARLDYAAHRLISTHDKILDIALDSGFKNLGHFYKVFEGKFRTSPRRYRLHHQKIIKSP